MASIIVTDAPAGTGSGNSGDVGVNVEPGTTAPIATNCTINVGNTDGLSIYKYQAYYGPDSAGTGTGSPVNSGSTGISEWQALSAQGIPLDFYVQFMGATPKVRPQSWTNYDGQGEPTQNADGSWSATCTSTSFANADIQIQIAGGSGEPGK
jgi:hypothetical protein